MRCRKRYRSDRNCATLITGHTLKGDQLMGGQEDTHLIRREAETIQSSDERNCRDSEEGDRCFSKPYLHIYRGLSICESSKTKVSIQVKRRLMFWTHTIDRRHSILNRLLIPEEILNMSDANHNRFTDFSRRVVVC